MDMAPHESWHNVGKHIRTVRKANRLTISQLASGSGLSTNAISLVERGQVAPSIETLCKIAQALGVSAGSLFQEICPADISIDRAQTSDDIFRINWEGDPAVDVALTAPGLPPFLRPAGRTDQSCCHSPHARQSVLCLSGHVAIEIGDQRYCLEPGDRLTFNGDARHRWKNLSTPAGVIILVLPVDVSHTDRGD